MKKEQFRKLIREEVISTLQQVLPSLLAEAMVIQQEQTEQRSPVQQRPQQRQPVNEGKVSYKDLLGLDQPEMETDGQGMIKFSDNPILNEILNNTQGGIPQQNSMLPPAYQMAMQQEEAAMMAEMNPGGMVEESSFQNMNASFANDFGSKISKFVPTPEPSSTPTNNHIPQHIQEAASQVQPAPKPAPQSNQPVMSEAEAVQYAESFGGEAAGGGAEISMDFINSIGKKAGAIAKESSQRSSKKGYSNIDFSKA